MSPNGTVETWRPVPTMSRFQGTPEAGLAGDELKVLPGISSDCSLGDLAAQGTLRVGLSGEAVD
jgi:hypothetical protein